MDHKRFYIFRLRIVNLEEVHAFLYDAERYDLGQPKGKFGYATASARIEELRERARQQAAGFADLTEDEVQELGELLFKTLFDEKLCERFAKHVRSATSAHNRVRLEVEVEESVLPQIAVLPWEFMHIPDQSSVDVEWMGTSDNMILARHQRQDRRPPDLRLNPGESLRIALAVASPSNPGIDGVTLGKVNYQDIEDILNDLQQSAKNVEVMPVLLKASRDSIYNVFQQSQPPHIFHFIGHGRLRQGANNEKINEIALTTAADTPDWVSAAQFARLFDQNGRPRVVVLQACESALGSPKEAFVSAASQVVKRNIPVVVAMQYEIKKYIARD